MEELERTLYINKLFAIYGGLLTDTQKDIISDYYELNLSLSEIAENRGISRAAVDDAIKKGVKKLEYYEEVLKYSKTKEEIFKKLAKIGKNTENAEILKIIKDVEDLL